MSRTGTVTGVLAGGIPPGLSIVNNLINGEKIDTRDVVNVVMTVGVWFVEFSGLGEAYDGTVGLITAGASLLNDIVNFF